MTQQPHDVDAAEWARFEAMLKERGQTFSYLAVSYSGRFYDVAVIGESVPIYQIRRVRPDG